MKLRDYPAWLVRDVIVFVGVMMTFWSLHHAFVPAVARAMKTRRPFSPAETGRFCRLLAEAEAWLAYAIARRAFRLAGLKASRVQFIELKPAFSWKTFDARGEGYIRDCLRMDELAEKMAARIRRLAESRDPLRLAPSARSTSPDRVAIGEGKRRGLCLHLSRSDWGRWIARTCAQDGGGLSVALARRAGLRVRAPPWLELNSGKSAPTRLEAPASEDARTCAQHKSPAEQARRN